MTANTNNNSTMAEMAATQLKHNRINLPAEIQNNWVLAFPGLTPGSIFFLNLPFLRDAQSIDVMVENRKTWFNEVKANNTEEHIHDVFHDAIVAFLTRDTKRIESTPVPEMIWFIVIYSMDEQIPNCTVSTLQEDQLIVIDYDYNNVPVLSETIQKLRDDNNISKPTLERLH